MGKIQVKKRGFDVWFTQPTEATRNGFLRSLCRSSGWIAMKRCLRDHLSPAHSRALNGQSQLIHTDKELAMCSEQVLEQKTRLTMPMCAELVTCHAPSFMQVTLGLFSAQFSV